MTKHRQQHRRVRAKGIDSMWNQGCSSLFQSQVGGHTASVQKERGVVARMESLHTESCNQRTIYF